MQYAILSAENPAALTDSVSAYLEEGWEPLGGLAVDRTTSGGARFFQALAKQESSTLKLPRAEKCAKR